MLMLAAVFAKAVPEYKIAEEMVQVDYVDGTYHASLAFDVPVPTALAMEVLSDFEHMSSFVPNLDSSRILRREADVVYIAQQGTVPIGPFAFKFESERRVELLPGGRLISEAISGSAKKMHSEFRALPRGH